MKQFAVTFKNEFTRMLHRRKLPAGMIIAAAIPLIVVISKVLALGWSSTLFFREDLFRFALSLYAPLILPLFAIVLIADAFTDEQSKGSMKTSLLLPDSRYGHFMAKSANALTGSAIMVLTLLAASFISGLALPSRGGWLASLGLGFLQGFASLLPVIMVLGFASLASQFIKSGSGMVLTMIGLAIAMRVIPLLTNRLNGILPTTWLGFGAGVGYIPAAGFLTAAAGMLLWAMLTGGLALIRFERRFV